ncbi:hypothetical protein BCR35DRAFT_209323 [Leucosporidium creatinivorum]|uniref:MYND-type domain-containing protein n=1 Tax=Leucosporidium creatinivorum TaxID=106004 RepID=A0A1Y2DFG8_9BASI|nr:hypothetical protein BCR35DRAFT_209323 [Leucosporidium creatinivorum]
MSHPPQGVSIGCSGCFRQMGAGTLIPKPLLCGACRECYYCGAACQRRHWAEHKPLCKRIRRGERQAEETALAEPRKAGLRADFDAYTDLISLEVAILALRSAFHFGKPDALIPPTTSASPSYTTAPLRSCSRGSPSLIGRWSNSRTRIWTDPALAGQHEPIWPSADTTRNS